MTILYKSKSYIYHLNLFCNIKSVFIIFIGFVFLSCEETPPKVINTDNYELIIPTNPKAILILFPGFGGDAKRIKQQSRIPQEAIENNISVLLFNTYNHHLFLTYSEKIEIEKIILNTVKTYRLGNKDVFLGGFSSGGNIALLIANQLNVKGVFIIDSPVDLANLYLSSEKKVKNNMDKKLISEPKYLITHLNKVLGSPNEDISLYENYSPYTSITDFTYNIHFRKNISIRLYTEPDLEFYKKRFNKIDFADLNAYSIQKMYNSLLKLGYQNIEYIETKNKGYRANGDRVPHSWSIVDEKEIVDWILKNN